MKYRSDRAGKLRWTVWLILAAAFAAGLLLGALIW